MELNNEHPDYTHNQMKKFRTQLVKGTNGHLVVCEVLRLTYDLVHDLEDKELREKIAIRLTEALIMAKKMSDRLHFYRDKYPEEQSGKRGTGFKVLHKTKRRRRVRMSRHIND